MEKERNPRGLFLRKAVFCLGEHELYSVQLVYFRSPGVIINGNNICLRISFCQSFYKKADMMLYGLSCKTIECKSSEVWLYMGFGKMDIP